MPGPRTLWGNLGILPYAWYLWLPNWCKYNEESVRIGDTISCWGATGATWRSSLILFWENGSFWVFWVTGSRWPTNIEGDASRRLGDPFWKLAKRGHMVFSHGLFLRSIFGNLSGLTMRQLANTTHCVNLPVVFPGQIKKIKKITKNIIPLLWCYEVQYFSWHHILKTYLQNLLLGFSRKQERIAGISTHINGGKDHLRDERAHKNELNSYLRAPPYCIR